MKASFIASAVVAAGLAGCATGYVPPPPPVKPGPETSYREVQTGAPGMFGDLRWNIDMSGKKKRVTTAPENAAEQQEFSKWQESAGTTERRDFEEWRAWQEWKRKNPK